MIRNHKVPCSPAQTLVELKQKLEQANSVIGNLQATVAARDGDIGTLNNRLDQANDNIRILQTLHRQDESDKASLTKQNAGLQKDLDSTKYSLAVSKANESALERRNAVSLGQG